MKHNYDDFHRLMQLLTPSWLSGLIALAAPILFMGIAVTFAYLQSSFALNSAFLPAHQAVNTLTIPYHTAAMWADHNRYAQNLPLVVFWAGVGVIVYMFVLQVLKVFGEAVTLEQEMNFIHTNRGKLIREALLHVVVRSLDFGLWILVVLYLLHQLLPASVGVARNAVANLSVVNTLQVFIAMVLLILSLLLQTVLFRLLFFRVRVFAD